MSDLLLSLLEVPVVAFLLNVIPAFAPPTWIVLGLYKISNPDLSSLLIAFFGVVGSVCGRLVLFYYSNRIGKYLPECLPEKGKTHIDYLKRTEKRSKFHLFLLTFFYSLSPLPSNFIFITFGVLGFELLPVIAGFALGRFISYSLLVYGAFKAFLIFGDIGLSLGISNISIIADIFGIAASVLIVLIDWKRLFEKFHKRFVRLEPEVRPEYIKKLMKIHKGKHRKVEDFAKEFGLK